MATGANRPAGRPVALVRSGQEPGAIDATVVDEDGAVLVRVEGYRAVELPGALDPRSAAPFRAGVA